MIYKFRVTLDVLDDVFRDVAIRKTDTFEDLHFAILQAFGFEGQEIASFYKSDEQWNQGEEIALEDMSDGQSKLKMMSETHLEDILSEKQTKLIYVYDFLNMWTFYVELADITEPESSRNYPDLLFAQGQLPENPPEKKFEADLFDQFSDEFSEELDNDGLDLDDFEDLDFDERMN
ncbi:IS1096 element passenger TnpR family protein [Mesohalobacter halotolerans]|uniref:Plasmid pRiA4b ORF-3 family protein n=1 Tax=Mesohalobacter halotolerans TaxID=1883405 RepID=A0A4U5TT58_9FLAO|nr:plasmid pRiA4b ORF-3 family protein [Mesohalobacter halotolerans]MBS3738818.1 hypothetical protein [Psychroflexus sp.]TKS56468.1 plasmid pRiA4b ORF-3 family protein [Mesohalobacter halotolerans]